MARIYSNENFPFPCVEELRRLGHDVLTIQETGTAGIALSDEEVLAYASGENRVLVTFNRKHFVFLHERTPEHAGTIVCTFDRDFVALAKRIDGALQERENMENQLVRIQRPNPLDRGIRK